MVSIKVFHPSSVSTTTITTTSDESEDKRKDKHEQPKKPKKEKFISSSRGGAQRSRKTSTSSSLANSHTQSPSSTFSSLPPSPLVNLDNSSTPLSPSDTPDTPSSPFSQTYRLQASTAPIKPTALTPQRSSLSPRTTTSTFVEESTESDNQMMLGLRRGSGTGIGGRSREGASGGGSSGGEEGRMVIKEGYEDGFYDSSATSSDTIAAAANGSNGTNVTTRIAKNPQFSYSHTTEPDLEKATQVGIAIGAEPQESVRFRSQVQSQSREPQVEMRSTRQQQYRHPLLQQPQGTKPPRPMTKPTLQSFRSQPQLHHPYPLGSTSDSHSPQSSQSQLPMQSQSYTHVNNNQTSVGAPVRFDRHNGVGEVQQPVRGGSRRPSQPLPSQFSQSPSQTSHSHSSRSQSEGGGKVRIPLPVPGAPLGYYSKANSRTTSTSMVPQGGQPGHHLQLQQQQNQQQNQKQNYDMISSSTSTSPPTFLPISPPMSPNSVSSSPSSRMMHNHLPVSNLTASRPSIPPPSIPPPTIPLPNVPLPDVPLPSHRSTSTSPSLSTPMSRSRTTSPIPLNMSPPTSPRLRATGSSPTNLNGVGRKMSSPSGPPPTNPLPQIPVSPVPKLTTTPMRSQTTGMGQEMRPARNPARNPKVEMLRGGAAGPGSARMRRPGTAPSSTTFARDGRFESLESAILKSTGVGIGSRDMERNESGGGSSSGTSGSGNEIRNESKEKGENTSSNRTREVLKVVAKEEGGRKEGGEVKLGSFMDIEQTNSDVDAVEKLIGSEESEDGEEESGGSDSDVDDVSGDLEQFRHSSERGRNEGRGGGQRMIKGRRRRGSRATRMDTVEEEEEVRLEDAFKNLGLVTGAWMDKEGRIEKKEIGTVKGPPPVERRVKKPNTSQGLVRPAPFGQGSSASAVASAGKMGAREARPFFSENVGETRNSNSSSSSLGVTPTGTTEKLLLKRESSSTLSGRITPFFSNATGPIMVPDTPPVFNEKEKDKAKPKKAKRFFSKLSAALAFPEDDGNVGSWQQSMLMGQMVVADLDSVLKREEEKREEKRRKSLDTMYGGPSTASSIWRSSEGTSLLHSNNNRGSKRPSTATSAITTITIESTTSNSSTSNSLANSRGRKTSDASSYKVLPASPKSPVPPMLTASPQSASGSLESSRVSEPDMSTVRQRVIPGRAGIRGRTLNDDKSRRAALFIDSRDLAHFKHDSPDGVGFAIEEEPNDFADSRVRSVMTTNTDSIYSEMSLVGRFPTTPSYYGESSNPSTPSSFGQSRWNSLYLQDSRASKRMSQLSPINGSPPSPIVELPQEDIDNLPAIPSEPPTPFFDADSQGVASPKINGKHGGVVSPPNTGRSEMFSTDAEEADGWTTPVEEETKEMVWNAARIGLKRRATEDPNSSMMSRSQNDSLDTTVLTSETKVTILPPSAVGEPLVPNMSSPPQTSQQLAPAPVTLERSISEGSPLVEQQDRKRRMKKHRTIDELVSTERSFARDMLVVRDVFVARARGASAQSIRTTLAKNDPLSESTLEEDTTHEVADAAKALESGDVRVLFGNIEEVASLSNALAALLEKARGSIDLDEEQDNLTDTIGEVFIEMIPRIQEVYAAYCSRHDRAIQRLQELDPILQTYFVECRSLSRSRTTAWDLSSLLIKPVQRCLKYPLLLDQILSLTPITHPDYSSLQKAHQEIILVAEYINEVKRRQEIVTRIVSKQESKRPVKRPSVGSNSSFSVPKRIFRTGSRMRQKAGLAETETDEIFDLLVDKFEGDQEAILRFLSDIKTWSQSVLHSLQVQLDLLQSWQSVCVSYKGEVQIHGGGADVVASFVVVIQYMIEGPWKRLNNTIRTTITDLCSNLLTCFDNPRSVIDKRNRKMMDHSRYLALKNKSELNIDEQLIQASQTYVALSAQLIDELPKFLSSVTKYFDAIVHQFAIAQAAFYEECKSDLASFSAHHCTILSNGPDIVDDHRSAHSPIEQALITLGESLIFTTHRQRSKGRGSANTGPEYPPPPYGSPRLRSNTTSSLERDRSPRPTSIVISDTSSNYASRTVYNRRSRLSSEVTSDVPPISDEIITITAVSRPITQQPIDYDTSSISSSPTFSFPNSGTHGYSEFQSFPSTSQVAMVKGHRVTALTHSSTTSEPTKRKGYPLLSYTTGDIFVVMKEEPADAVARTEQGRGWLLVTDDKGQLGWVRKEEFSLCP